MTDMNQDGDLQRAHTDEVRRLQAIEDPAKRIVEIRKTIDRNAAFTGELATLHRDAVRQMRETMSAVDIAQALGITVQRVGQLLA